MKRSGEFGNSYIKFRQAKRFRQEMTPSERLLWSRLRGNWLLGWHFRKQHVIRGFIVDFFCHRANLVVETDGGIHRSRTEVDTIRDDILLSLGLVVLHISNERLEKDLEGAIREIQDICTQRISQHGDETAEQYRVANSGSRIILVGSVALFSMCKDTSLRMITISSFS
jgi:very-short-patch-repair endonuclease